MPQLMSCELAAELGFSSNLSREKERALHLLAGYTGQEAVEHLATVIMWNSSGKTG